MESAEPDRVTEVLARVLDGLPDPDFDLTGFLRAHADIESEVRTRLRRLIEAGLVSGSSAGGPGTTAPSTKANDSDSGDISPLDRLLENLREGSTERRYRILGSIGRGGMGVVHRAWDERLAREVALKVGTGWPKLTADVPLSDLETELLARFLNEARIAAGLNHPGIVPVHDMGVSTEGEAFFVMRLVGGEDFSKVIDRVHDPAETEWSFLRAAGICTRVAEIIAFVHSQGVLHRDLKPTNIRVGAFGEVHVMDWGVSKLDLTRTARPSTEPLEENLTATSVGQRFGTLAFMPPEQARGEVRSIDERSDVYALGAVLYALLTGKSPYADVIEGRDYTSGTTLFDYVASNPPSPLKLAAAPDAPAELIAIAKQAMARSPRDRYPSVVALVDDLRAFAEGRVVGAYRTGLMAEVGAWVRRNRGLARALATSASILVIATVVSTVLWIQSSRQETRFEQLGTFADLEQLYADANGLWPLDSANVPAWKEWLGRAAEFGQMLPELELTLAELRSKALSVSPMELPDHEERASELAGHIASLEKLLETRLEGSRPEIPAYESQEGETVEKLVFKAQSLIGLGVTSWDLSLRGLSYAFEAKRRTGEGEDSDLLDDALTQLALGHFALGLDREALSFAEWAIEEAELSERSKRERNLAVLLEWTERDRSPNGIQKTRDLLERLRLQHTRVSMEIEESRTYEFSADEPFSAWWHARLTDLVAELEGLFETYEGLASAAENAVHPKHGWSLRRRLAFVEGLASRRTSSGVPLQGWTEQAREIGVAHGLDFQPQEGLVPIGRDPQTGLWEFWVIASGEEPLRGADGRLIMNEESGIVLVLLPGGDLTVGFQRHSPQSDYFDLYAVGPGLRSVSLSPFFVSKYELTQGQWRVMTGTNSSSYKPRTSFVVDESHPVESTPWNDVVAVLRRFGLDLPTEAQWEYAARAGTKTTWWTGSDPMSLQGAANVGDMTMGEMAPNQTILPFRDGYVVHAPVGSFRANGFGLHDVCGNVAEMCLDDFVEERRLTTEGLDPICIGDSGSKVIRGGSFDSNGALNTTSAYAGAHPPDSGDIRLGFRPARKIE